MVLKILRYPFLCMFVCMYLQLLFIEVQKFNEKKMASCIHGDIIIAILDKIGIAGSLPQ